MFDVFISHASADKEGFVRALAEALRTQGLKVWYDEYTLGLGDSIRQKIDSGLANCRFGLVVLSRAFFAQQWTQWELSALINQEMDRGNKVLLPVWHGVSQAEVARYSPPLADRIGISSEDGIEAVVEAVLRVVRPAEAAPEDEEALRDYEVLYAVHEGHYGVVLKCRNRRTGELCIVKHSASDRVSFETLTRLTQLDIPNLAAPTRVWQVGPTTYEELPYVGGVKLSEAAAQGLGGLSGSVLEGCHRQLMQTLGRLHAAGIVHRDVHPDNVYMIVDRTEAATGGRQRWQYGSFGIGKLGASVATRLSTQGYQPKGATSFRIAWVLVDCSFAAPAGASGVIPFRHGPCTPEEQALGAVISASDMYALGATLYYAITGEHLPPYGERKSGRHQDLAFPSGRHSSVAFPRHLEGLVALDPEDRPRALVRMQSDTVAPDFTGLLLAGDGQVVMCNTFDSFTSLVRTEQAIEMLRKKLEGNPDAPEHRTLSAMIDHLSRLRS